MNENGRKLNSYWKKIMFGEYLIEDLIACH